MITIKLTPEQYDTMIHALKLARDFCNEICSEKGKQFQELINEIDIVDDVEIKKDDKS